MTTSSTDSIAAYAATTQQTTSTSTLGRSADQLDMSDFLSLMTAQLQNQDPLNPLDGTAFVAQLAQFGTVSGIQEMQTSLGTLSDSLRSSQVVSGTTLVGHAVLAAANSATLGTSDDVEGLVTVPTGATDLTVTVTDSSGQVVRTMQLTPTTGTANLIWDGNTDTGTRAPAGTYNINAVATVAGQGQSPEIQLASLVNSVTMNTTDNSLTLNTSSLGAIPLSKVRSVM